MSLSYCTNVHPAEDLDGILRQLDSYALPVRERVGVDRLGLGLWLATDVAAGLAADPDARRKLKAELTARGLTVETLNAFPYKGFHDQVVKHAVYVPRWTEPERLRYTLDCVTVLSDLLAGAATYGSISTLPLGWREPWTRTDDIQAALAFEELTTKLRHVAERDGRPIRIAVEPEPGCVLDTLDDAVGWLARHASPEYVGVCLDTCHLAVSFADPAEAVAGVHRAGLDVVKVQASAALHIEHPDTEAARAALEGFAEPRYLHQVRELAPTGEVRAADDLPEALGELPGTGPWRVHFHVPLHADPVAPLRSTAHVIGESLAAIRATYDEPLPHVEVETYTWNVLPESHRQELVEGIAAELAWAEDQISELSGAVAR
jgi:sugar phosphate isomerase/epimerase